MSEPNDHVPGVGVLVVQLGTPAAPTKEALRPFLAQFLSDPRVIDLNPLKWQLILRFIILRKRPARSAALYRNVWTDAGSPLMVHARAQVAGLQLRLGDGCRVVLGMRYGEPSVGDAMRSLVDAGIQRIVVFPMFPQFSCSTTGSIYDAVTQAANGRRCPLFFDRRRYMPALRYVPPYYDDPGYIAALRATIEDDIEAWGQRPERYLFTFHGLPQRYVDEGDPYRGHCETSARLLARALELSESQWVLGFQSRFGKEKWLTPYTDELLRDMGQQGVGSLAAACPGFTADCLETTDEIGREGGRLFADAGGQVLRLTPCLNAHPVWLDAMADIVRRESAGWVST
jgi:protoporphyrin/coproporphyrin ferrochelatase